MKHLHLRGMGLVGSILALHLEDAGVSFNWSDADCAHTAWKASTGCCYPSSDPEDQVGYAVIRDEAMLHPVWRPFLMRAAYGYSAAKAPHSGGRTPPELFSQDGITVLRQPSYHLNVQAFVLAMRQRFAGCETVKATPGSHTVVTHGFSQATATRYFWGWCVPCDLELTGALLSKLGGSPLCLNLQHLRYGTWYAYPRVPEPGGPPAGYLLGTSLIAQWTPRRLSVDLKLARVLAHLYDVTGGAVRVRGAAPSKALQGWRPKPLEDGPLAFMRDGELHIRPQYASGFRHYGVWLPPVLAQLREQWGIAC